MHINNKNLNKTYLYTKVGVLSAIATILMYFEISLIFIPEFLKIDLSEIPALLGAFAFGPITGILIELIKNVLHLFVSKTTGVGEVANFLIGSVFVGMSGLIYRIQRTRQGAIVALVVSSIVMTIIAVIVNYYFLIPMYQMVFNISLDQILIMSKASNNNILSLMDLIIYAIIPFNLIKGFIISIVILVMYKRISPILHK